jgi:formate--tetrahydrofolate ligase
VELADETLRLLAGSSSQFRLLYPDDMPLWEKARTIALEIYGADDIVADSKVRETFQKLDAEGYGHFPVCIAKTQYSFTTDPARKGAPQHHLIDIRDVRLAAGAEFVIAVCGDIMTMPGLPRVPAATRIDVLSDGRIVGLS